MPPDGDPLAKVITADGGHCRLAVLVSPRSSRDGVGPLEGDRLRVRVTAAAVDNAANKAVVRLLSDRLAVARGAIEIEAGQGSRRKLVALAISAEDLRGRLASILDEQDEAF